MAEYIEKQEAERIFRSARRAMKPEQYSGEEFFIRDNILLNAEQIIHSIPPADVRPVVRGRWIVRMSEVFPADSTIECDQCHEVQTAFISDSYCPNCGADMRGGDADGNTKD